MDDYNLSSLEESKNEWCSRLVSILTSSVITGVMSIYKEALRMCDENDQEDKYLMTFQNLLSRVPEWNPTIVETERKRIEHESRCKYLEDLVTCVHIIQLKILTTMRVGQKQKKIDINIPKLDDFIHKVYVNVARKVYKNVYLFEINIQPLQVQKNYRELEIIVQECILNTLRESIPVEAILKAYMDESIEEDVIEEVKEEVTHEPIKAPISAPIAEDIPVQPVQKGISFNDIDYVQTDNGISQITAPKNIERLEEISSMRNEQRKHEQEDDNDNDNIKLNISDQSFSLDNLDVHNIEEPKLDLLPDLLIDEIEVLE